MREMRNCEICADSLDLGFSIPQFRILAIPQFLTVTNSTQTRSQTSRP